MVQDQINLSQNLKILRLKCYSCKNLGHLINDCPTLHFCPNEEKVIKKADFSYTQQRNSNFVRSKKKHKFECFKLKKTRKAQNLEYQGSKFISVELDSSSESDLESSGNESLEKTEPSGKANFLTNPSSTFNLFSVNVSACM